MNSNDLTNKTIELNSGITNKKYILKITNKKHPDYSVSETYELMGKLNELDLNNNVLILTVHGGPYGEVLLNDLSKTKSKVKLHHAPCDIVWNKVKENLNQFLNEIQTIVFVCCNSDLVSQNFSQYILKDYPNMKIGYYHPVKNHCDDISKESLAYKCAITTTNWDTLFKLQEKYGEKIPKEETIGLFKVEAARMLRNLIKEQEKDNYGKMIYEEKDTQDCTFQYIGSETEEEKKNVRKFNEKELKESKYCENYYSIEDIQIDYKLLV